VPAQRSGALKHDPLLVGEDLPPAPAGAQGGDERLRSLPEDDVDVAAVEGAQAGFVALEEC
jgi:hypothetical protein